MPRAIALTGFFLLKCSLSMGQTQFNSTGPWTAFKDVESQVQARCKCSQGELNTYDSYIIQFKNSSSKSVVLEYTVTGPVSVTKKESVALGPKGVTPMRIVDQPCGNAQSPDIFVSAIIVKATSRHGSDPKEAIKP